MRAFIAVDTTDDVRYKIARLIHALRAKSNGVKWVDSERMHITMYFLGEILEDELEMIEHVIQTSSVTVSPFVISVEVLSAFPRITAPRVLWVGVKNDTGELKQMHDSFSRGFIEAGVHVKYETSKKFTPHITIGRVKGRGTGGLVKALDASSDSSFGVLSVTEVVLYKSMLTPGGPLYDPLRVFPLIPPGQNTQKRYSLPFE